MLLLVYDVSNSGDKCPEEVNADGHEVGKLGTEAVGGYLLP